MVQPAAPPTPQEVSRKLSIHSPVKPKVSFSARPLVTATKINTFFYWVTILHKYVFFFLFSRFYSWCLVRMLPFLARNPIRIRE